MAELGMGTLLDYNKSAIKSLGALNKAKMKTGIREVEQFFKDTDNTYYMMLCHENRDYTVFRISEVESIPEAASIVKECLENRGKTYSIEKDKNGAIEIWIEMKNFEDEDELYCYLLFPYDAAIIEV